MLLDFLLYFLMGGGAGLLAGVFGLGGGILVVPGLAFLFTHLDVPDDVVMHMAAGTSLAVMAMTSAMVAVSHYRLGTVRFGLVRNMLPGILLGVMIGAVVADYLDSDMLFIMLAIFLVFISVLMFRSSFNVATEEAPLPHPIILRGVSSVIGFCSGIFGIGAGVLSIPFLSRFGVPMNHSASVASTCTFFVALVGTASFMITGLNETEHLAYSTGYIYWPAFAMVSISSMIFAPIGAVFSKRLPAKVAKRLFAGFLLLVAAKIFI